MPGQGTVEAGARAHHILSGSADVEQAHLVGEEDGQAAHQQRRRLHQSAAQVFKLGVSAGIGHKVLDDGDDRFAGAGRVDEQQHHIAHQQSDEDAQQ